MSFRAGLRLTRMTTHHIGTREEWLAARRELLAKEKDLTHRKDALARERLELPWVPLEKEYAFDTDAGQKTLAELFDGRSQLLIYHFMFGADWDAGCVGCSFLADHLDGMIPHVNERDVTVLCASRAPLEKLQAYKRRMGWKFDWVSSYGSDFGVDFGVSFTEEQQQNGAETYFGRIDSPMEELGNLLAFALEDGVVHHTYSGAGRDDLLGAYELLDRAPRGRDEDDLPAPYMWWRRHDEYELEASRS